MNATKQFTLTPEEVEASDRFHYEAETQTLNDIFFSKYRVAEDDNGETIFLKKYEKSPLTPAEDTFILDTIKEELIPEYVLPEKKKDFYLPKFAMGLIKEYMDIKPEYRRNKEAEMIKKWWCVEPEVDKGCEAVFWRVKGTLGGSYNKNWYKEDGKTVWSMLEIRRAVCRDWEGNLKKRPWMETTTNLWAYKMNELQFNRERLEGVTYFRRTDCWIVEKSTMMEKIKYMMSHTLTALKNICRAQGIKGHSGKKKWALVNHMIDYGTNFDIYQRHRRNKITWEKIYPERSYTLWLNNTRVMKP